MKNKFKFIWLCFFITMVALSLHMFGSDVLAAEGENNWRSSYDLIMKWVNFGILVIVLVKFTGGPIKEFLQGRKEELALEMKKVENEKEKVLEKIKEVLQTLEESSFRFEKLKERIVVQGESEKQKIIEDAQEQSRIMLEGAKRKIENRIHQGKKTIRAEMIDAAIELAFERLPNIITDEDNKRSIETFLNSVSVT